jgi:hypothetical protein
MSPDQDKKTEIKKAGSAYLQYTGLAFQMAGIIFFSIFIGKKLDAYFEFPKPYLTGLLSLLTITGFIYKLYVDLLKKEK